VEDPLIIRPLQKNLWWDLLINRYVEQAIKERQMGSLPDNIPEGWEKHTGMPGQAESAITKTEAYGLHAVCSIDAIDDGTLPNGEYLHMSISRPHQTPGWKECSRYVWESGLFDSERPIVMILWPPKEANLGFAIIIFFRLFSASLQTSSEVTPVLLPTTWLNISSNA